MAGIQLDAGDHFGSQETYLESMSYIDITDERYRYCLTSNYNGLAISSLRLKNYKAAIEYTDLTLALVDSQYRTIALNNKALALQYLKNYDQALQIYDSILPISINNRATYARILSNYARTKWLRDSAYPAAMELLLAKKIRQKENDTWGLNASYAHLSDYYSNSQPDSALYYAGKMYQMARINNSPDDELEALQKMIRFEQPINAKKYFERYMYLNDSIQLSRNAAKNQFALIRYEAEKSKAENAVLQKDNTEKRVKIANQRMILWSIVFLFALATFSAISWYRKRKQKMEWEKEKALKELELKTSKKVHDVVANGLYRIMATLEHEERIEKEKLINHIEMLYEKSRDISYESSHRNLLDFHNIVSSLLASFGNTNTKVLIVGNSKDLWKDVTDKIKENIEPILQELMINMKKHSRAKNVVLRFDRKNRYLVLHYTDDGIGFPNEFRYGNGLTNTENRIKSMSGTVKFENAVPKGTLMKISIPLI